MHRIKLDAKGLRVQAGGKKILEDVSLSVLPGEFVAIMGPSGSGKSTLLQALNGFRPAGKGTVELNGQNLYKSQSQFRSVIGYVPQDDIIHETLSVYRALYYSAHLRLPPGTSEDEIKARVEVVIKKLGLAERKKVRVRRLSGGQRKRVSLGVELLSQPPLLFLDEPTSGLDPGLEEDMTRLFRQLADEGRTVLVTTHITESLEYPDVVALIAGGRLVYYAPPGELLAYFQTRDYPSIFKRLRDKDAQSWANRFRQSALYRDFVAKRFSMPPEQTEVPEPRTAPDPPVPPPPAEEPEPDQAEPSPPAEKPESKEDSIDAELAKLKQRLGRD